MQLLLISYLQLRNFLQFMVRHLIPTVKAKQSKKCSTHLLQHSVSVVHYLQEKQQRSLVQQELEEHR